MAKASGSTRTITSGGTSVAAAHSEYVKEMGSGRYDLSQSYFSEESGGSVLVYKGRTPDVDEMFAAKAMANDGLKVKITPEGKIEFSTGEWGGNTPMDWLTATPMSKPLKRPPQGAMTR